MMTKPARAGSATHKAVSIKGAARVSVFCHEYQSPKAPLNSSAHISTGLTPPNQTNTPNSSSAAINATMGNNSASTMAFCMTRCGLKR